jgi:hypothetical protein
VHAEAGGCRPSHHRRSPPPTTPRALWSRGPPPPWPAPTIVAEGEKWREGRRKEGDRPPGGTLGSATGGRCLLFIIKHQRKKQIDCLI